MIHRDKKTKGKRKLKVNAKVKAKGYNLAKYDPTKTSDLRKKMEKHIVSKFARLKAAVRKYVVTEDKLGLKEKVANVSTNEQINYIPSSLIFNEDYPGGPAHWLDVETGIQYNASDYFSHCPRDDHGWCGESGSEINAKAEEHIVSKGNVSDKVLASHLGTDIKGAREAMKRLEKQGKISITGVAGKWTARAKTEEAAAKKQNSNEMSDHPLKDIPESDHWKVVGGTSGNADPFNLTKGKLSDIPNGEKLSKAISKSAQPRDIYNPLELKDMYLSIKKEHPETKLIDFQHTIAMLAKQGEIKLGAHTRALSNISEQDHKYLIPLNLMPQRFVYQRDKTSNAQLQHNHNPSHDAKGRFSSSEEKGAEIGGIELDVDGKALSKIDKVFKGKMSHKDVAEVAGAMPGSKVKITGSEYSNHLHVVIDHADYHAERTVLKDRVVNDYLTVHNKGSGKGTEIFASQVANAIKHGFSSIETEAAKSPTMNGYYTWPRLGYDAEIPSDIIQGEGGSPLRVSDLMQTKEGREFWKKHGNTLPMSFDLKEGSNSRRVLNEYRKERSKRKGTENQENRRSPRDGQRGRGYPGQDLGQNSQGEAGQEGQQIAIIGGGPGGLLTAYLLRKKLPNAKITIYEASDRLGGKIKTQVFQQELGYHFEGGVAELYGAPKGFKDPLREIIDKLGLDRFPIKGEAVVLGDDVIKDEDSLPNAASQKSLDDLYALAHKSVTPEQYHDPNHTIPNNHPMVKKTYSDVLEGMDEDARKFVEAYTHPDVAVHPTRTTAMYGLMNLLTNDDRYLNLYSLRGGIEELPKALAKELSKDSNVKILLNTKIIEVAPAGVMYTVYTQGSDGDLGGMDYHKVICCLPAGWVQSVDWQDELDLKVREYISPYDNLGNYLRVTILFNRPFWREVTVNSDWDESKHLRGEHGRWTVVVGSEDIPEHFHAEDIIHATVKHPTTGKRIGIAQFKKLDGNNLMPESVHVETDHRRQGVATAIYQHMNSLGYKIVEQKGTTKEGKKFRQGLIKKGIIVNSESGKSIGGHWWMSDAFDGCCCYDESARIPGCMVGILGWLIAGDPAQVMSNYDKDQLTQECLNSLPTWLRDEARLLYQDTRINRYIGEVSGLPGTAEPLINPNIWCDKNNHPSLLFVGDYQRDGTLNGLLQSVEDAVRYLSKGSVMNRVDIDLIGNVLDVLNSFCPTGVGGGQDNSCTPKGLAGKVISKLSKAEHAIKGIVSSNFSKLPKAVQTSVKTGLKVAFATWSAGQEFAEKVALQTGLSKEKAAKLKAGLMAADLISFKPIALGAAFGNLGHGIEAAISLIPPATAAYLLHSTAKHPIATLKAAIGIVKDTAKKVWKAIPASKGPPVSSLPWVHNASNNDRELILDALTKNHYDDWYTALLHSALGETKSISEAIELANAAKEVDSTYNAWSEEAREAALATRRAHMKAKTDPNAKAATPTKVTPAAPRGIASKISKIVVGKVKAAYDKFSKRYGKTGAIAMIGAMALTIPIPGNILGVIGAAEGIRAGARLLARNKRLSIDEMVEEMVQWADHLGMGGDSELLRPKLRKALAESLAKRQTTNRLVTNKPTPKPAYDFPSSPDKLDAFQEWIQGQYDDMFDMTEEQVWGKYIEDGMSKGIGRAFDSMKQKESALSLTDPQLAAELKGSRTQFLEDSFLQPVAREKLELIASRTFDDLEGITGDMSDEMGKLLTEAMNEGLGAEEVADQLDDLIGVGSKRAMRIARTELSRAHSEGSLIALKSLGVSQLGVEVEFTVKGGEDGLSFGVCDDCMELQGEIYPIEEASGIIPLHPNCLCAWVPYVPDEEENKGDEEGSTKNLLYNRRTRHSNNPIALGTRVLMSFNKRILSKLNEFKANSFCPTGTGGGQDNSCSSKSKFSGAVVGTKERALADEIEKAIAKSIGAIRTTGYKFYDAKTKDDKHFFEIKSSMKGEKNVLNAHEDALLRKVEGMKEKKNAVFHTIFQDERDRYENGAHAEKYSGHKLYYKRGNGRYALSQMHKVKNATELKRLINTPDDELPEAAKGSLPKGKELSKLKEQAIKAAASRKARDARRRERAKANGIDIYQRQT